MLRILIFSLIAALAPASVAPLLCQAQTEVFENDPVLERNREATVRVRNGNGVGTGTFFMKRDGKFYILTNAHVAGRQGNRVTFQMWWRGYLSKEIPGTVVFSVMARNYYRDIAIIEVDPADLGGYEPPVIPLAPADYEPKFQRFYSFGCGAGSWLTNWEGHSIDFAQASGEVIHFVPQPAGGRSGSAIFSHDGQYIVALIAWRSPNGDHSLDGNSENESAYGIAMTFREVLAALSGTPTKLELLEEPSTIGLAEYEEFKNAVSIPQDAPQVFRDNTQDINDAKSHGAENILQGTQLKFLDSRNPDESKPANGGIIQKINGAQYNEISPGPGNQIFPGVPRSQPPQESPQPPAPEQQEQPEGFPFGSPERPRLRPEQPRPEPTPPAPPELQPDPQPEPLPPEELPPGEEYQDFAPVNWIWLAVVGLGLLGWVKTPLNWFQLRLNAWVNRDKLRKLVCDESPTPAE